MGCLVVKLKHYFHANLIDLDILLKASSSNSTLFYRYKYKKYLGVFCKMENIKLRN